MVGTARFGGLLLFVGLLTALSVEAQPQGRRGRGRGGPRRAEMMLAARLPVEQVLGFLAFNAEVELTNDQLLKVRDALKGLYAKRSELAKEMREGDRQAVMEKMGGLRTEMTQNLSSVLKPAQVEKLKEFMQRIQRRRQGGRRPGGGQGRRGGDGGTDS